MCFLLFINMNNLTKRSVKGGQIPWQELNFERQKVGTKAVSKCLICFQIFQNTSYDRLLTHRNVCKGKKASNNDDDNNKVANENQDSSEVPFKRRKGNCDSDIDSTPSCSSSTLSELDELLATFFVGCNVPFSVVESTFFRNFVKKLNPDYRPPCRNTLSNTILDKLYVKVRKENSLSVSDSSVLILDGWKNKSKNEKYVASILHNATGERVFLDSWDFTQERETGVALKWVVEEATKQAKENYQTDIYAVVSDNASNMTLMGKLIDQWFITCNSHSGNLLAKALIDDSFSKKAIPTLKEFKSPALEKEIVKRGGIKICLPGETRWCSYRDSLRCFLRNLVIMRAIVQEKQFQISKESITLIFDGEFEQELLKFIIIFDVVCTLINKLQSDKSNIADAIEHWLSLKFPICEDKYESLLKARLGKVIRPIGLAANILHPVYRGNIFAQNAEYEGMANNFLKENLKDGGLKDLKSYLNNTGIFESLNKKSLKNPQTFWDLAQDDHPELAKFSKKLLNIPSSSAALERLFSQWSYVHNKLRNRLNIETSKKLIYLYYTFRINDHQDNYDDY
ncbi:uncharacterized protein LOC127278512 [Leptopilina boulardi]|uniref:uncharacterized protein LOC127278512 n=1 Tax=Leptopilina boulardi TaxID=63433 RepID=UPI0021F62209|nr:uncharacterized protein LOC127278512 [Leptopilina boulardi]